MMSGFTIDSLCFPRLHVFNKASNEVVGDRKSMQPQVYYNFKSIMAEEVRHIYSLLFINLGMLSHITFPLY